MRTKRLSNEKGQVLMFVTLAFVILGMFLGLAVDGGRAYLMRERLRSIVDAAALAGAKAMAGPTDLGAAEEAARQAACDSAKVNGLDAGACDSLKLKVEIGPVPVSGELGVIVTGTDTSRTFFMALGGLIGCASCETIDVKHVGVAVPDTLVDVVLVMDDTGTMSTMPNGGPCVTFTEPGCPIAGAKQGAITLVNMLLADPTSHAMIAFVPFRGCYNTGRNLPADPAGNAGNLPDAGCIEPPSEESDLTNDASVLTTTINTRRGAGGFPGTNVCLGMHEGRNKLFGFQSRAIARKVMVVLTDGDQSYSDHAGGGDGSPGNPNLGNPTPTPYPLMPYRALSGDGGHDTISPPPGSCMATSAPGGPVQFGPQYDPAIDSLDGLANAKAATLKKTDPNPNGTNVEIYVLRFANPPGDDLSTGTPPGSCEPALVGVFLGSRVNSNDIRDRNLSRCLASNTANGDPFAVAPNDHYFYAATATGITTQFNAIATNILRKRRLVS